MNRNRCFRAVLAEGGRFRQTTGLALLFLLVLFFASPSLAAEPAPKVYVILWFDTEDYLLPASDDAAMKVAEILTQEGVRATFKVVGEKARALERRGRTDVIVALKKHEIGYHSNYHSVQPTPAMYLADLGWDDGVAEFDRREKPGFDDVKRIFGAAPSCYGQPGSSWGPQSYGAMKQWGMKVYLDAGSHVALNDHPFYYCGILNFYKLEHQLRADLHHPAELEKAQLRFAAARQKLLTEGGGVVSVYYHPCEFVHKEFWDGVNFRNGANPPREDWKPPAQLPVEATQSAYKVLQDYVRFMKRFGEVQFITASEAGRLYADAAQGRTFSAAELKTIAQSVGDDVTFQSHGPATVSAGEILVLLNEYLISQDRGNPSVRLGRIPDGPSSRPTPMHGTVTTDWSQFLRTASDVQGYLTTQGRVPTTVWLGSKGVPPESYLAALAKVVLKIMDTGKAPAQVMLAPARLAAADHVADDNPRLWGWVIFPRGFLAPRMMELAKRQAWTLKPALLANQNR